MWSNPSSSGSSDLRTAPSPPAVDFSLVIPAYNEAAGIEDLVREADRVLGGLGGTYELVVVDDGSRDETRSVLQRLAAELPALRTIMLRVNSGQHVATFIGLRESSGRTVFLADADMKGALAELPRLLETAQTDPSCDIVSGIRARWTRALHRSLGSLAVSALVNGLTGTRLRDPCSPLRLYRRRVVEAIVETDVLAQNLPILTGLLGLHIREVPVDIPDGGRRSRYGLSKLVHVLLLAVLNFSAGTRTILTLIALGAAAVAAGFAGMVGLTSVGRDRAAAVEYQSAATVRAADGGRHAVQSDERDRLQARADQHQSPLPSTGLRRTL